MTAIDFPREHRPHVEFYAVRDRSDGRRIFIFEFVGRDRDGPFRVDVAHRYSLRDALEDVAWWARDGFEVRGPGVSP